MYYQELAILWHESMILCLISLVIRPSSLKMSYVCIFRVLEGPVYSIHRWPQFFVRCSSGSSLRKCKSSEKYSSCCATSWKLQHALRYNGCSKEQELNHGMCKEGPLAIRTHIMSQKRKLWGRIICTLECDWRDTPGTSKTSKIHKWRDYCMIRISNYLQVAMVWFWCIHLILYSLFLMKIMIINHPDIRL